MSRTVIVANFDAVGGPRKTSMGEDGYPQCPTDSGVYVLAGCWKHSSSRYAKWSKVRWGSPIKEEKGEVYVMHDGKWFELTTLTGLKRIEIEKYYETLYGTKKLPKSWVFNDFGHNTCYYFTDKNKNRRLDKKKGEKIHGEFFHTTPDDEANTKGGKPVFLTESHGCIHIKPIDIDTMTSKGYMKKGNTVVIHRYDEKMPYYPFDSEVKPPYSVHFFPGEQKIIILGKKR